MAKRKRARSEDSHWVECWPAFRVLDFHARMAEARAITPGPLLRALGASDFDRQALAAKLEEAEAALAGSPDPPPIDSPAKLAIACRMLVELLNGLLRHADGTHVQSVLTAADRATQEAFMLLDRMPVGAPMPTGPAGPVGSLQEAIHHLRTVAACCDLGPTSRQRSTRIATRRKRSTGKGEGQRKCTSAILTHHKYDNRNGSCDKFEPIGNNELARLADVDKATASAFFKKYFKGLPRYKALCCDPQRRWLYAALKALAGDYAPKDFYSARTPDEIERSTDADE